MRKGRRQRTFPHRKEERILQRDPVPGPGAGTGSIRIGSCGPAPAVHHHGGWGAESLQGRRFPIGIPPAAASIIRLAPMQPQTAPHTPVLLHRVNGSAFFSPPYCRAVLPEEALRQGSRGRGDADSPAAARLSFLLHAARRRSPAETGGRQKNPAAGKPAAGRTSRSWIFILRLCRTRGSAENGQNSRF